MRDGRVGEAESGLPEASHLDTFEERLHDDDVHVVTSHRRRLTMRAQAVSFLGVVLAVGATTVPLGGVAQETSPSAPPLAAAEASEEAGATRVTVTPFADWVVTAGGDAWVGVGEAVTQLDGADGTPLATLPVPGETCLAMDVGFDSDWVGACRRDAPALVRIDPATASIVATIPLPVRDLQAESSLAAGESAVWALDDNSIEQTLVKVDPQTDAVVVTFPLPGGLSGVRAGYGGVWIAKTNADTVSTSTRPMGQS